MTVPAVWPCKQTKEQENVSDPDVVICKVTLRSARLAKCATTPFEHRIMMAQAFCRIPALGGSGYIVAEAEISVTSL
jgi:hypothetical protein